MDKASRRMLTRLHRYELNATSIAGPWCDVRTKAGHMVCTDLPRLSGGRDAAAQPVELLVAALLGCKTATAHFVARHLWPRPYNTIDTIEFLDVAAVRDERGAIALPIKAQPEVSAALLRVTGIAKVKPTSDDVTDEDVRELGRAVETRCPVAATLVRGNERPVMHLCDLSS